MHEGKNVGQALQGGESEPGGSALHLQLGKVLCSGGLEGPRLAPDLYLDLGILRVGFDLSLTLPHPGQARRD